MCYLMICPSCSWRVAVRMLYYYPKTHQLSINLPPYSYTHPHTSQQYHKGKSDSYKIRVITDDQLWSVQPCTCCDSGSDSACTKRVQQNHGGGFFRKKKNKNIILVCYCRLRQSWALGTSGSTSTSSESGKPWY